MRKAGFILLIVLFITTGFRIGRDTTPYPFPVMDLFPEMPVSAANPVTVEGVALGRYLFYDPILSKDSTLSCASCHKQSAAFSDAPNAFSKGAGGLLQSRNTIPLFNLAWYPSFFWDGKAGSIEEQVFHPVRAHNEMNLDWASVSERLKKNSFYRSRFKAAFGAEPIDSTLVAKAIAQFERTLLSYSSKYDKVLHGKAEFTPDEYEGFVLINDMSMADCLHCHTTDADVLGTTRTFSNNGLDKVVTFNDYTDKGKGGISGNTAENGWFKIPSLRNIALTPPYMHDGRFKTLEEVLDFYSEGVHNTINIDSKMGFANSGGVHLTQEEKQKIIAFLHTLTDSVFITNPTFSNPFIK